MRETRESNSITHSLLILFYFNMSKKKQNQNKELLLIERDA